MSKSFARPDWDEYFMLQAELAKLRSIAYGYAQLPPLLALLGNLNEVLPAQLEA